MRMQGIPNLVMTSFQKKILNTCVVMEAKAFASTYLVKWLIVTIRNFLLPLAFLKFRQCSCSIGRRESGYL